MTRQWVRLLLRRASHRYQEMGSLRQKLASSYGLLIIIILAVSAWGIHHLVRLGRSIDVILVNNYRSIQAAENMKEALERQNAAALSFMTALKDKTPGQFTSNSERFSQEFEIAANNITEPGEDQIIADIDSKYSEYREEIQEFFNMRQAASPTEVSRLYLDRLEPDFLLLKNKLDDLLRINQQAMLDAKERAMAQSWRAQISAAVMASVALVIALLFAWWFINYVVGPISTLTEKAKRIAEGDFEQPIDIQSRDEIGVLAAEFNRMTARLRDLRRSDNWRMLIEQKKSDAVIDSISDPVLVTDMQGRLIKINRAAEQLFGASRDEVDRDTMSSAGSGAAEDILRAVKEAVAMQRPVTTDQDAAIVPVKIGDTDRGFRLRNTPMRDPDGRLIGAITLLEEATEIKRIDRLKDEFIAIASDKLRAPLHALRMALHALAEESAGELAEKQAELVWSARQDADQLDDLISDLVELAEIEAGRRALSIERLRVVDAARLVIERHRPLAESKHIKLSNNIWSDMYVMADRDALKRILDNLVSNAIRHTERGGEVTLESWLRHDAVFIAIKNTGEGIPPEHLPEIFGRFVHTEGFSGATGLGLALVKRLVEIQGGQVAVESRLGEGATFTFSLPEAGSRN